MEPQYTNDNYQDPYGEIDLKELLGFLWEGKKLIIAIVVVSSLCSIFYALSLKDYYRSEAILSISGDSEQSMSLSRFSGLASIAGVNLPTSSAENKGALVQETIKSRTFLKHLITFEGILPSLMAAKTFDIKAKALIFDNNKYNVKTNTWVRKAKHPYQSTPSVLEARKEYLGNMAISQDKTTGFITISIEHISPVFAKNFLDLIIREVNVLLRQKDLRESSDALEFLTTEISKTSLIEIKSSINQLIQTQLQTQMMARINDDYILRTIEPPFIPETKSKPSRSIIVVLGAMLGGILGILWILIRHYLLGIEKHDAG